MTIWSNHHRGSAFTFRSEAIDGCQNGQTATKIYRAAWNLASKLESQEQLILYSSLARAEFSPGLIENAKRYALEKLPEKEHSSWGVGRCYFLSLLYEMAERVAMTRRRA